MGQDIDLARGRQHRLQLEVVGEGLVHPTTIELEHRIGVVDGPASDPVHRPDEEVPRVRIDQIEHGVDGVREVVDLESQQDGKPAVPGGDHRIDIPFE